MHPNVHHCFLGDKRIKNHRIGQRRGEDPCADDKQCTDTSVSAYPSSTMESGEGRLAGIPWMKAKKGIIPSRETRATMPGVRRKNSPGSASVRLQLHQQFSTFSSLDWEKKNPNKKIYSYRSVHACMPPPRRSLLEPPRLIFEFSAGDSSSLSLSLPPCGARFVCPRVRPTTRADCTFSARSSRSPSTKPPHWEDSADVTGGVHRRGGIAEMYVCVSVCRCACARFWKE